MMHGASEPSVIQFRDVRQLKMYRLIRRLCHLGRCMKSDVARFRIPFDVPNLSARLARASRDAAKYHRYPDAVVGEQSPLKRSAKLVAAIALNPARKGHRVVE